jgi:hypothetical protein
VQGFLKIDMSKLVIHQVDVVVNRASEQYLNRVRSNSGWLHQALPLEPRPPATYNTQVSVNGLHTSADFDIPHGEFFFAPDPTGQFFSVQQFQCYISVMRGPGCWTPPNAEGWVSPLVCASLKHDAASGHSAKRGCCSRAKHLR